MSAADEVPFVDDLTSGRGLTAFFTGGLAAVTEALTGGMTWAFGAMLVNIPYGQIGLLVAMVGLFVLAQTTSRAAEDAPRGSMATQANAALWVGVVFLVLAFLYSFADSLAQMGRMMVYALVAGLILLVLFQYFQNRTRAATRETALNQTQRTVRRSLEGYARQITAVVAIVAGAFLALFSGAISGLEPLGDVVGPYLGEIGFLWVGLVGYMAQGGAVLGTSWTWAESITPAGWAIFIFATGAAIIMFRN